MLIGILSDTHDHMEQLGKAVDLFNRRGVGHVIHAGDFASPFTFRVIGDLRCDFTGVFGNNDGDRLLLQKRSGGRVYRQPRVMELAGRRIVVVHEHHIVEALADSGHYNVVIYGHTHEPDIRMKGKTLIVNPGETGGWLYGKSTVALADLADLKAEIVTL